MKNISIRTTNSIQNMLQYIANNTYFKKKSEIIKEASMYIIENSNNIDFDKIIKKIKFYDKHIIENIPKTMKFRIDENIDSYINIILKEKFSLERIHGVFKIKILLIVYIEFLIDKSRTNKSEETNKKILEIIRFVTKEENNSSIDTIFEFIINLDEYK